MKKCLLVALVLALMMSLLPAVYAQEAEKNDLEPVEIAAKEPIGTSPAKAKEIAFGTTYYHGWTPTNDNHYLFLKFTTAKRGVVKLQVEKAYDSDGDLGKYRFAFYDANGNIVYGNDCYKSVDLASVYYTVYCGMEAGTYYLAIDPAYVVKTGVIDMYYSVSFEANWYTETEGNESMASADVLTLGKMYKAYMGPDGYTFSGQDVYKFFGTAGHTYRITVENFAALDPTTALIALVSSKEISLNYKLTSIDSDGNNYYEISSTYTGPAYLRFYNYNKNQIPYGIKVTDVTSSAHAHQYEEKVTLPTCAAEGYTTFTCSCGDSYVGKTVPATNEHAYSDKTDYVCDTCGYVRSVNSRALAYSVSLASQAYFGETYRMGWTTSNYTKTHYTKITLSNRSMVTLKVNKPFDATGDYGKYKITFYDLNGTPIFGNNAYKSEGHAKDYYVVNCGLEAGTYYVSMYPTYKVTSGTITMDYTFYAQPMAYCETEGNETPATADSLVFDKMYQAHFGPDGSDYCENDYFKFDGLADHTYRLTVDNYGQLENTTALFDLIGNKTTSLDSKIMQSADAQGRNYFEFTLTESRTYYLRMWNYNQVQFPYGIMISDVTSGAHTHRYTSSTVAATCEEQGYTLYVCACGDEYRKNYTSALGHKYVISPAVAPTCTTNGSTEGKACSRCGDVLSVGTVIPAEGHQIYLEKAWYDVDINETMILPVKADCGHTVPLYFSISGGVSLAKNAMNAELKGTSLGVATVNVYTNDGFANQASCKVFVHAKDKLELPEKLRVVEEEAFAGGTFQEVIVGENVAYIEERAFADCENLVLVHLPDVVDIDPDAFDGSYSVKIVCSAGSDGYNFARQYGYSYILVD